MFATAPLPDPAEPLDTLIVAGGQGVMRAADDPRLLDWLRSRANRARRIASVCTGAFLLAAAGLLDRRRAVTHWEYCDLLCRRYPAVKVEPDRIFVKDGEVWSSAGVTAGIDLSLALVEEDLGRGLALGVARNLVVFLKRPGGQAQFSAALSLQSADDRFADLHSWLAEHLADELSLARLAARAGMSERSFLRRYREATGMTPARAVERLRVEAARQLLVETRLPAKRIAARCGFGSEETMRRSFARLQGVSPQDYRQRFGD
jgi:transcriptional regulator GlxA family with amidase domain